MGSAYSNYVNAGGGDHGGGGAAVVDKEQADKEAQEKQQAKTESQSPNITTPNEQGKGAFDTSMNRYDFMGGLQAPHF